MATKKKSKAAPEAKSTKVSAKKPAKKPKASHAQRLVDHLRVTAARLQTGA